VRARCESSVDAAVAAVASESIDVCVVDLATAGGAGTDIAARLRSANPSISLIAIAGRDVSEMMRQVAASGVFACMRKPVAPTDLIDAIARARGRRAVPA
jgi:DNA-binding NtrC family response regulator